MEALNDTLIYILEAFADILVGFAIWGIYKLVEWFQKKTGITVTTDTINAVVKEVYQTFVEPIKKGLVEGKTWDDATKQEAKELALTKIKELLSEKTIKVLNKLCNNLDEYLSSKIEEAVNSMKTTAATTTTTAS